MSNHGSSVAQQEPQPHDLSAIDGPDASSKATGTLYETVNDNKQASVIQQPPGVYTRLEKDSSTGSLDQPDKPIHSSRGIADSTANATLQLYEELDDQSTLNNEKTAPKVYQQLVPSEQSPA